MQQEFTKNGMLYTWDIVSSEGAGFILFPAPHHAKEDIEAAKREIRDNRDVVWLKIATEDDKDDLYKSDIFDHTATRPLRWYEIEADTAILRRERLRGTTPDEYVMRIVLPNIEQTRAKNITRFGDHILSD